MEFVTVGRKEEIPVGQHKVVQMNGTPVAIINCNGTFHAIRNICPHRGGPVGEGKLDGNVITCPWHGYSFDLTTGVNTNVNPSVHVDRFEVQVEGDDIKVAKPGQ